MLCRKVIELFVYHFAGNVIAIFPLNSEYKMHFCIVLVSVGQWRDNEYTTEYTSDDSQTEMDLQSGYL